MFGVILHIFRDPLRARNFSYESYECAPHASESSTFDARASQNPLIFTRCWASKPKQNNRPNNGPKIDPKWTSWGGVQNWGYRWGGFLGGPYYVITYDI